MQFPYMLVLPFTPTISQGMCKVLSRIDIGGRGGGGRRGESPTTQRQPPLEQLLKRQIKQCKLGQALRPNSFSPWTDSVCFCLILLTSSQLHIVSVSVTFPSVSQKKSTYSILCTQPAGNLLTLKCSLIGK